MARLTGGVMLNAEELRLKWLVDCFNFCFGKHITIHY